MNTRDPLLQDGGGAGRKKWLVGREQPVQQAVGGEQQSCQDPEWQKKRQCKTIICTSCHARRIRAPLYACSFVGAASQASYTGCQRREEARQVHHLSPDWLTRLYGARVPVGGRREGGKLRAKEACTIPYEYMARPWVETIRHQASDMASSTWAALLVGWGLTTVSCLALRGA